MDEVLYNNGVKICNDKIIELQEKYQISEDSQFDIKELKVYNEYINIFMKNRMKIISSNSSEKQSEKVELVNDLIAEIMSVNNRSTDFNIKYKITDKLFQINLKIKMNISLDLILKTIL